MNRMADVAKMFGKKLGEEFTIKRKFGFDFEGRFSDKGFEYRGEDKDGICWNKDDGVMRKLAMMDNKMAQVAEMLGVKLGEAFKVKECAYNHKLTEEGLKYEFIDGEWGNDSENLIHLVTGKWEIIKKPWKPAEGNGYWYIAPKGDVCPTRWYCDVTDLTRYAAGNCFRKQEEALAHKDKLLEELRAKYEAD